MTVFGGAEITLVVSVAMFAIGLLFFFFQDSLRELEIFADYPAMVFRGWLDAYCKYVLSAVCPTIRTTDDFLSYQMFSLAFPLSVCVGGFFCMANLRLWPLTLLSRGVAVFAHLLLFSDCRFYS